MATGDKKTILCALSGGVDSSVAAMLLKQQGLDVVGVYLRLTNGNEEAEKAAEAVCRHLDIRFYPVAAGPEFEREVVDYFVQSYQSGLTPNPCVVCNRTVKFGVLLRLLGELKGDKLATGHYARISIDDGRMPNGIPSRGGVARTRDGEGRTNVVNIPTINNESPYRLPPTAYRLARGLDPKKDQSYFLYTLNQEQLRHLVLPLGELTKDEVRRLADDAGLPYLKKESQDVCFLQREGKTISPEVFLRDHIALVPGPIKTLDDKIVGEHRGLPLYTVGQRKGIEIGGTGPYYVVRADRKTNTLYVVTDHNDQALLRDSFTAADPQWQSGDTPPARFTAEVVIRYGHTPVDGTVDITNPDHWRIELASAERAVTPGQSAVFYDGDTVLGGGIIE